MPPFGVKRRAKPWGRGCGSAFGGAAGHRARAGAGGWGNAQCDQASWGLVLPWPLTSSWCLISLSFNFFNFTRNWSYGISIVPFLYNFKIITLLFSLDLHRLKSCHLQQNQCQEIISCHQTPSTENDVLRLLGSAGQVLVGRGLLHRHLEGRGSCASYKHSRLSPGEIHVFPGRQKISHSLMHELVSELIFTNQNLRKVKGKKGKKKKEKGEDSNSTK